MKNQWAKTCQAREDAAGVMPGWTREGWQRELERKAASCDDAHQDQAERWWGWAVKLEMERMQVKCNKCEYVGDQSEFPTGNDFLQNSYVSGCPKCDNRQSPGSASMRMFDGARPFEFVRPRPAADVVSTVMHRTEEAS